MDPDLSEDDLAYAGIAGRRELLLTGRVTAVELLDSSLTRIARLDPQLNAFRQLFPTARAEAEAADAALSRGEDRPLLGIPIAVKDNVRVAGYVASQGTSSPEPAAQADAEIVRRLRAAGAVIVGSTNLPELALWPFTESPSFGQTRNPWDRAHTPGGSSGGSAAAVASGMVAAAHATDGGGSIRIPASCCGLVGLKPTRGQVSLAPDVEHWHGLSSAGCVTRTVADTGTMLSVLRDEPLHTSATGPLRIAWSLATPLPQPVDPEIVSALSEVVATLQALGHTVFPADPDYSGVAESFTVRYAMGARDDLASLVDPSVTEPRTRLVAAAGQKLPTKLLDRALRLGREAAERLAELPGDAAGPADLLVTPTMAVSPPRVGMLTGRATFAKAGRWAPFTPPWNVTGQPAMSIPAGESASGLPLGVQLVAGPGRETLLLQVAQHLEDVLHWPDRRPPLR